MARRGYAPSRLLRPSKRSIFTAAVKLGLVEGSFVQVPRR